MYTIYCHVFPDGKRYVGCTGKSVQKRWGRGSNYKNCKPMYAAIEEYGWDSIQHIILATAETKEEAEETERKYIKEFDCTNPEYGYNTLPGGNVSNNYPDEAMRHKLGNGKRGRKHSEEEKQRISDGVKKKFDRPESNGCIGKKASDETKRKMSDAQTERWKNNALRVAASERLKARYADPEYKQRIVENLLKHPSKPRPMSEDAKAKLSKHFKGKWLGENGPCSVPVIQLTREGEFVKRWANAGEAQRAGIANRSNIGACCRHKVKTAGGYRWEYESSRPF